MAKLKLPHPDYLKARAQGFLCFDIDCPGCKTAHRVIVNYGAGNESQEPKWGFNCDLSKPTFTPSILVRCKRFPTDEEHKRIMAGESVDLPTNVCHSFIRDGEWQFLSDSTHALAGKTVPMIDV